MLIKLNKGEFICSAAIVKYQIVTNGSQYILQGVLNTGQLEQLKASSNYDELYNLILKLEEIENEQEIISIS